MCVDDTIRAVDWLCSLPLAKDARDSDPSVLRKYDLGDLMLAVSPQPVLVIGPVDAVGVPIGEKEFRRKPAYVFESNRNVGFPDRVRFASLERRDLLPPLFSRQRF